MRPDALFIEGDLSATLRGQRDSALRAVEDIPETEFKSSDPSALASRLFERFRVEPAVLTEGVISVEAHDAEIDRRRFRDIDHGFPGAPPTLKGTRVVYYVPFTGDENLFRLKPSKWTTVLPYAVRTATELRFVYDVRSNEVAETKRSFERDLELTKQWLGWVNKEVVRFNEELSSALEGAVDRRNARLAQASEGLAALGLPVRTVEPARIESVRREPAQDVRSEGAKRASTEPYDVALSFAGEDRGYVEKVAGYLKAVGVHVFYDRFESVHLWGRDLIAHLQDVYQNRARFCVLFISEHYVSKPWPKHERQSAQARALVADEEYLLPARFDDTPLPGLPPSIGFVDLRGMDPEDLANLVLRKLGRTEE